MKQYYVHFAENAGDALPDLNKWNLRKADSYEAAAIGALKRVLPWEGVLFAHVHGLQDPKHENGMPLICHTFELRIEGRNEK